MVHTGRVIFLFAHWFEFVEISVALLVAHLLVIMGSFHCVLHEAPAPKTEHIVLPANFVLSYSSSRFRELMDILKRMVTTVTLETPYMEKKTKHCVFLPLILILQLAVKGGNTPAKYSRSGSFRSPWLRITSKYVFFPYTVISLE